MKKTISIITLIAIMLSLFTVTTSAAQDWLKVGSKDYYTVKLDQSLLNSRYTRYALVKIESRNSPKNVSSAKVHVTLKDANDRYITEFDISTGRYFQLGNDHSTYKVYVSKYVPKGGMIDSADAFLYLANDEWRLTSANKCSISSTKKSSETKKDTAPSKPVLHEEISYFISPKHTGTKCVIDTEGGNWSTHEGANALLWNYGNSKYNSRRYNAYHVKDGYYKIVNANSGLVLDVNTSNLNVGHYKYHGGSNQLWRFVDAGNGYLMVISKWSNNGKTYCLDVHNFESHNGANVEVYPINYGDNQKFKFWY